MLKNINENIDNRDVVEKNEVGLLCFSKDAAERLQQCTQKVNKNQKFKKLKFN